MLQCRCEFQYEIRKGIRLLADLCAFRGCRYHLPSPDTLTQVIAPPYDVISAEEEEELRARHPLNVVRLTLGKNSVRDSHNLEQYRECARLLTEWRSNGALRSDPAPSFYVYRQDFHEEGQERSRLAVVGALRLEPFKAGVVRPHERTLAAPKVVCLESLRLCRANLSPVFLLFDDEQAEVLKLLGEAATGNPRARALVGNVLHQLWVVDQPDRIEALHSSLRDRWMLIADGHHRYEMALDYREEVAASSGTWTGEEPENFLLVSCVAFQDPGLCLWPTHRLVPGPVDVPDLLFRLSARFDVEELREFALTEGHFPRELREVLPVGAMAPSFVMVTPSTWYRLRLRLTTTDDEALDRLDVTVLHELVLRDGLGINTVEASGQQRVEFNHEIGDIVAAVKGGEAGVGFLLRPTRMEDIRTVISKGDRMPQKATFFYPKMWAGLVFRPFDGV